MRHREFQLFLAAGLASAVRVLPAPLSGGGARTAAVESDRSSQRRRQWRRFFAIDSATRYLQRLGDASFQVDPSDAAA